MATSQTVNVSVRGVASPQSDRICVLWYAETPDILSGEEADDLSAAQLIAGHADVRTTQGYVHLGDAHLREIHQKVFD